MFAFLFTLLGEEVSDDKQLEHIIKKYSRAMYKIAYSILENKVDAEDAIWGVWSELAHNTEKIPDYHNPSGRTYIYLCTAAKYSSIDISKEKGKEPLILPLESAEYRQYLKDEQDVVRDRIKSNDLFSQAVNIISEMPGELRQVMTLIYMQEKTYDEVSEILNIPVGTVKSRQSRALKILREHFDCKKN